MAKEIFIKKNVFGNFEPIGVLDKALIADLPVNKPLKAKITQPRSVPQNSLYWVILGKVIENQEMFPSAYVLHDALKARLGYNTTYMFPDGYKFTYQGSTAFENQDAEDFKEYFDKAMELICRAVIPGLDLPALLEEIENNT